MKITAGRLGTVLCAATLSVALPFVGGTAVGADSAQESSNIDLRTAPESTAISDSWIAVLKDGNDSSHAFANSLLPASSSVTAVYDNALNGFAAKMTKEEARELAADPRVAYVEQNAKVSLDTAPSAQGPGATEAQDSPPWGLDRIDQRELPLDEVYESEITGAGTTAYIIDTGVRTTHNDFDDRARSGYDFVNDDDNASDCHGHGTHVAGTIAGSEHGVAKGADIVGVKVLNCEGGSDVATVVAGVDWVTENADGPSVVNMSLGVREDSVMDEAVENSIASGISYTVSAGNGNIFGWPEDACGKSPARAEGAITVGATDIEDQRASFSNYGECVDVFAPGVDIPSAWMDDDEATNTISGTSMAAPHVAGVVALYLEQNPSATPAEALEALSNNATDDVVGDPREGSPNKLLHSRF